MALKSNITTQHNLTIANAILVIWGIHDERQDRYQYAIEDRPGAEGEKYSQQINDAPERRSLYQVRFFASEADALANKPSIDYLADPRQPEVSNLNFSFEPDDASPKSKIDQAYDHLRTLYPDAVACDLSSIGVQ